MSKKNPITVSSWTLGDQCKFEDRVIAAKEAGYEGIGLRAETYVDALNEGLYDEDILAILDKHGMKVTEVEYIVQWAEDNRSYEQKYKEQMCFHMCDLFGVNHINCGLMENYSSRAYRTETERTLPQSRKRIIGIEPMPYSGIPNLEKAWAVVKASGAENAYIILEYMALGKGRSAVRYSDKRAGRKGNLHPDQRCIRKTIRCLDFKG